MKGREAKGPPSADLLVCFPSRSHLALMPKPICSPARPSEPTTRHRRHHHHLKKSSTRGGGGSSGCGQASSSPLMWAKNKSMDLDISEPTSPKVTCAGQIKVRPKANSCKSWQSVMEEIERIHNSKKEKKKSNWVENLGFKKEIVHFLTCLRTIRFDFRCFGSFPQPVISSEDEEDDDEDEEDQDQYHQNHVGVEESDGNRSSRTIFSNWYMVLQENQNNGYCKEKEREEKNKSLCYDESVGAGPTVPPSNALLLMRCRSAPAKTWLEEREEEDDDNKDEGKDRGKERESTRKLRSLMDDEKREEEAEEIKKTESFGVMKYESDFYKISTEIAKETWVVGGIRDALSRSQSWKR